MIPNLRGTFIPLHFRNFLIILRLFCLFFR